MPEHPKPPALANLVHPDAPVFLRKMNKKTDWGSDETPSVERVSDIIELVFSRKTQPFSVFLVQSDEDLHRVIVGMNGGRDSLTAESHFVAILEGELIGAGIRIDHTPHNGITNCRFANSLHHDLHASDEELRVLCLSLIDAGRKATTFTKGRTKIIVPDAEALGCLAVPNATNCEHPRCIATAIA